MGVIFAALAHCRTKSALDPVSDHGITYPFGNRKTEPGEFFSGLVSLSLTSLQNESARMNARA